MNDTPKDSHAGPVVTAETERPAQRYVNEETDLCWAQGCPAPITHLLRTRQPGGAGFPDGLLVEAGYCLNDAMRFLGTTVALHGGTFVSLTEASTPTAQTPATP